MPDSNKTASSKPGAIHNRGMLVAWGGFKSSVERERATSFFDVRLWNQNDLIEALLADYENLDPEIRAELPLKRIWTVATQEEG